MIECKPWLVLRRGYLIFAIKMEDRDEYMNALEKAVDASLDIYLYIIE